MKHRTVQTLLLLISSSLYIPLSLLVPSAFCLPRASFLPRWWGRTTKQKKASLAVSSAHSPLLHNSWFAHFFSQWSAHISVSCEHCSRNVSKCSGYRSTLIQTKHIVQSHIHPNAYSCHCPPKSVASSMISPLSWILGNGILFVSLSAPTIGNYQNFNAGSSMGKLYFNRCPFFPSSSFECSLLYSLLLWHSAALFCFALLPSTLLPYMLCCF